MERLTSSHRIGITTRALRFNHVRLRAQPATAQLAAQAAVHRKNLATAYGAYLEQREERYAASAVVAYLDGRLDRAVMSLAREAQFLCEGDGDDPRYKMLFAEAPSSGVSEVSGPGQEHYVVGLIHTLKNEKELAALAHHAPLLQERLDALRVAVANRTELYGPENHARAAFQKAMDAAQRFYNLCHARLQILFPDDLPLVESFFVDLRHRRKDQDDDAGGTALAPESTTTASDSSITPPSGGTAPQ